jgi:hypothetical protein
VELEKLESAEEDGAPPPADYKAELLRSLADARSTFFKGQQGQQVSSLRRDRPRMPLADSLGPAVLLGLVFGCLGAVLFHRRDSGPEMPAAKPANPLPKILFFVILGLAALPALIGLLLVAVYVSRAVPVQATAEVVLEKLEADVDSVELSVVNRPTSGGDVVAVVRNFDKDGATEIVSRTILPPGPSKVQLGLPAGRWDATVLSAAYREQPGKVLRLDGDGSKRLVMVLPGTDPVEVLLELSEHRPVEHSEPVTEAPAADPVPAPDKLVVPVEEPESRTAPDSPQAQPAAEQPPEPTPVEPTPVEPTPVQPSGPPPE